ncbi:MAG TPA: DoxX family protein [Bacteroidia bacterium]|nr:DoxX family protein [Bacteroidia bacterium]HNU32545.1 DoxX family protein [Bacteroidia bacterium]
MKVLTLILKLTAAAIMLQTLFFKFSGSEESVFIFSKLGVEPWGRIAAGISELIASILILIPRTTLIGALMGVGIMLGAIASHIGVLGIVVMNDGGQLFIYALLVLVACASLVYLNSNKIPQLLKLKI